MKKKYRVECIENGNEFFTEFLSSETDKIKLKEFGQNHASVYGGECILVRLTKDQKVSKEEDIEDFDLSEEENQANTQKWLKQFEGKPVPRTR